MTIKAVYVTDTQDNVMYPSKIRLCFEASDFDESEWYDGFSPFTRIATLLSKYGHVTSDEQAGTIDVSLYVSSVGIYHMLIADLDGMCERVFHKTMRHRLLSDIA